MEAKQYKALMARLHRLMATGLEWQTKAWLTQSDLEKVRTELAVIEELFGYLQRVGQES